MSPPAGSSLAALVPPLGSEAIWASGWTPAEARLAVDQFRRGTFRWAWQVGWDSMGYPPIKAAIERRLAVPDALPWTVEGPARAPGRFETEAAQALWDDQIERLVSSTLIDVAFWGLSVWHHPLVVDPETERVTVAPYTSSPLDPVTGAIDSSVGAWGVPYGGVQRWPLSAVGWTAYPLLGVVGYYAIALGGQRIQLPRPGTTSGEWTVIGVGKGGDTPHLRGSVCAIDMEFTAGMLGRRARSNLEVSAGRASPVGYMKEGVPIESEEGIAANATLAGLGEEQKAALFPFGFKVDKFELLTTGAAELFRTNMQDSMLMVELAITGRGGTLAKPDAQYQAARGVEADIPEALTRRDVGGIERGFNGLANMLSVMNTGRGGITLRGHLPDADQAARRKAEQAEQEQEAKKLVVFHAVVHAERDNGFVFVGPAGQLRLNQIAARCGVVAPTLPDVGLPPAMVRLPPPTTQIEPDTDVPPERAAAPVAAPSPVGAAAPTQAPPAAP